MAKNRIVLTDLSTNSVSVFSSVSMAAEATTWFSRREAAAGTEERRRETVVGEMMADLRPENVGKETEGRLEEEEEEPWRGAERARIA